jgi:hypothetical protein
MAVLERIGKRWPAASSAAVEGVGLVALSSKQMPEVSQQQTQVESTSMCMCTRGTLDVYVCTCSFPAYLWEQTCNTRALVSLWTIAYISCI